MEPEKTAPCPHCGGTGQVKVLAEAATLKAFFFGCVGQTGHHWHGRYGHIAYHEIKKKGPNIGNEIDGCYCPGTSPDDLNKRTRPERVGEASLHHVDNWTVLAWWDRSVDSRPGSNSNLVAEGKRSFADMLQIGEAQFPHVMKRQVVPITLVEDHTT